MKSKTLISVISLILFLIMMMTMLLSTALHIVHAEEFENANASPDSEIAETLELPPIEDDDLTDEDFFYLNYYVYDEDDNFIFERPNIKVGDIYIDKNFNSYEIYFVDESLGYGRATYIETLPKPKITKKHFSKISTSQPGKKIGLYLTHNAESFVTGDGYDSIYGKGGIHDVAKELKTNLENNGITVTLDETLHLPHDSLAYSRSSSTAKRLLNSGNTAIFDIHRDGVPRSVYYTTYGGKGRSQVRIVVGQANQNKDANLQFALYLMSIAETICPWLIKDIYYASGHYNQALTSKNLLFEMGTYLIEKNLVMDSMPYLAEVINTTLFGTEVNENTGDITIVDNPEAPKTIDQVLENQNPETPEGSNAWTVILIVLLSVFFASALSYIGYIVYKKKAQ